MSAVANDEIRSLPQNAKFHAMCADLAEQVEWAGGFMGEREWKHLMLAAIYGQTPVPNPIDPQAPFIVMNNRRSSGLVRPEMSDLITAMQAFGDERGVKWSRE